MALEMVSPGSAGTGSIRTCRFFAMRRIPSVLGWLINLQLPLQSFTMACWVLQRGIRQLAIGMCTRKDGASAARASGFGAQNGSKAPLFDGQILNEEGPFWYMYTFYHVV